MKYDEIVGHLGDFGRYQRRVYVLLSLPIFCSAWHILCQVFLAGSSDHWCAVDAWREVDCTSVWNLTQEECEQEKRAASIPATIEDGTVVYSQCEKYNVTGLDFTPDVEPISNYTYPCDEGWIYDRSQYKTTIITDFNLVCDKSSYPEIAQSAHFLGIMIGAFTLGSLADRFGRYYTLYAAITITAFLGAFTSLSNSFWMYTILRFFIGSTNYAVLTIAFIAATELIGPSKRVLGGVAIQLFWALGYIVLAGLAALIRKWRYLQLTISLIPLLNLLSMFVVPESPRWLLSQKRTDQAMKILQKMSKVNGESLPKMDELEDEGEDVKPLTTFDMLRSPILSMRLFVMMFVWFIHTLVYYGLALSAADFGVSVYLAFLFGGFVELPAYVLTGVTMELFGRRPSTFVFMMIGGLNCILTPFVPLGPIRTIVATIGKFGISSSFALVYVWAVEIFPTPLRGNGLGLCTLSSQSGGIVSPLITLLTSVWQPLPFVIFGGGTLIAGAMSLMLPETKGQLMPETIADAEGLGRKEKKNTIRT
ncbi:Organic cation transporter protein [Holothuria leucospilota]|uniref:Organic cation transporter protein n=1 Tax=Holothuria leucospilota TaxID=206669 RepID=A0A9Q1BN45_HOLLE|nr:Organic cation transporter protein [Holothuria leucospilota]